MKTFVFLALSSVLFTASCGSMPDDQTSLLPNESTGNAEPAQEAVRAPSASCSSLLLDDGTDLASIFFMRDGVLHLKVPVMIEVPDTATALVLRGGIVGLDVAATKFGVLASGGDAAVRAKGGTGYGLWASVEGGGTGVYTTSSSGNALYAYSSSGNGAVVSSEDGYGLFAKSNRNDAVHTEGKTGGGWVECPEAGECGCLDGQHVTKTADRGARIFCSNQ